MTLTVSNHIFNPSPHANRIMMDGLESKLTKKDMQINSLMKKKEVVVKTRLKDVIINAMKTYFDDPHTQAKIKFVMEKFANETLNSPAHAALKKLRTIDAFYIIDLTCNVVCANCPTVSVTPQVVDAYINDFMDDPTIEKALREWATNVGWDTENQLENA